jgi:hypothetical protein
LLLLLLLLLPLASVQGYTVTQTDSSGNCDEPIEPLDLVQACSGLLIEANQKEAQYCCSTPSGTAD